MDIHHAACVGVHEVVRHDTEVAGEADEPDAVRAERSEDGLVEGLAGRVARLVAAVDVLGRYAGLAGTLQGAALDIGDDDGDVGVDLPRSAVVDDGLEICAAAGGEHAHLESIRHRFLLAGLVGSDSTRRCEQPALRAAKATGSG